MQLYPCLNERENVSLNSNFEKLEPYLDYFPCLKTISIVNVEKGQLFKEKYQSKYNVAYGENANEILLKICDYDSVVNSIMGNDGLLPTIEVLKNNKTLYLSNKESLIIAGNIVNNLLKENKNAKLYPIDSEHVGLYKLLNYAKKEQLTNKIKEYFITASGGALRDFSKQEIAKAMGKDGRISPKFLHCGPGYGGSCFPKDTKAIVDIAKKHGEEMYVIKAAIDANEKQKRKMVEKIISKMNGVEGKHIAVLGLSFKPDTDDMRDAPSIDIIRGLVEAGAKIQAYCPEGMREARWRLESCENSITYCADEYSAVNEVDAVVLMTEWHQFRGMNLEKVRERVRDNYYFDLRNVYAKDIKVRELFKYYPVGQE